MQTGVCIEVRRISMALAFLTAIALLSFSAHSRGDSIDTRQPNVLIIVADDMGFTDVGPFGSEIPTPNLDALAQEGVRFTRFYTSFLCSPTRAMLLSGTDNHLSGLGAMAEFVADNQLGKPGYEGYLSRNISSMAELMKEAGYHAYMVGKWHLGTELDQSPKARGFDRSFALTGGAASHFNDMVGPDKFRQRSQYREDGRLVYELPDTFYSTDYYTDKMLSYIDSQRGDDAPFLAYVAYTAPHWPLQVSGKYLDMFRGDYDEGYESLREQRFAALKEMKIIPEELQLPPMPEGISSWDVLTEEQKKYEARIMEIYAAMVNNMDSNIGRILDYLKRTGQYDNTFVFFFSDNGADGWMRLFDIPPFDQWVNTFDNSYGNLGKKGSFPLYHSGWAQAGEAPFKLFKGLISEGGIRKMGIAKLPGAREGGLSPGSVSHAVLSVMDVLPTALDLAGTDLRQQSLKGQLKGQSFVPLLTAEVTQVRSPDEIIGMEMLGQRAVIKDDWKLVWIRDPFGGKWELYNIWLDPAEQNDLAGSEPEKYREMHVEWDRYAQENNVILPHGPIRLVH